MSTLYGLKIVNRLWRGSEFTPVFCGVSRGTDIAEANEQNSHNYLTHKGVYADFAPFSHVAKQRNSEQQKQGFAPVYWIAVLGLLCVSAAHAQVITCSGVSANQPYSACSVPTANNAPADSSLILWCSAGASTGAAEASCSSPVWYRWDNMQPYSWVLSSYAGWQRQSAITFTGSAPPQPPAGTVTGPAQLSWTAPAVNVNGNPVTIASYIIQYGTTDFSQSVATTATTYTFSALAAGTWQFEILSVDTAGAQSAPSNPVTLTIAGNQTCGAAPAIASQTVSCPAGTTGTWTQTHDWSPAAYPTCWTATPWTPTSAPAGACTAVVQTWKTKAAESVYEAVLPLTGSGLVRGNVEGTIAAGKLCGAEQFKSGTTSYRTVADADSVYTSPTYNGRNAVAVCTLQ